MKITHKRDYSLTIDTLADITASMVEHHEQLDSAQTLNFIDHYRAYLQNTAPQSIMDIPPATFESFLTNQQLLDAASSFIALETGEKLAKIEAL